MAIVYSPRVIEIAVNQTVGEQEVVNVWHMQWSSEDSASAAEGMVEDFRNNWQDHILDIQCIAVKLVSFEWRVLDPTNSDVGLVLPDPVKPVEGQIATPMTPPNVAWLIHKNTDNRPRGRRDGRSYLCGLPESAVSDTGTIEAASVASANTTLQAFYDGISDSGVFVSGEGWPVVLETTPASRAPGTQSVTISSRRVTSLTMDARAATQRERLR